MNRFTLQMCYVLSSSQKTSQLMYKQTHARFSLKNYIYGRVVPLTFQYV